MDIIIYTAPETLKHKKDLNYSECWWQMSRMPKNFDDISKVYFATEGYVRGSFFTVWITKKRVHWNPLSWRQLRKKIPCKPFRGFRYKWWE